MSSEMGGGATLQVQRWGTERALFVAVLLASIVAWIVLAVSLIGIAYALMIGLFFFLSHVAFIAHLRGSAVRLGPEQMPELFERVEELAGRIGLRRVPEAYVMQAGGALNALATKFLSANFIVLYSDLLDACGKNTEARDMIVAHELGHLKAGHLRGLWFLLPGLFIPFLGSAYSRAREYTADRYGFAASRDRDAALVGMSILAAGGRHGPEVNLRSLAAQAHDLGTAWMTIGRWMGSHPPLADRIAAVAPTLVTRPRERLRGTIGALALILCAALIPAGVAVAVVAGKHFLPTIQATGPVDRPELADAPRLAPEQVAEATEQAWGDMQELSLVIEEYRARTGEVPEDWGGAYAAWKLLRPGNREPVDPFDGAPYGYEPRGEEYILWSEGPSSETNEDDLVFESGAPR